MIHWSPFEVVTVWAIGRRLALLLAAVAAYTVATWWLIRWLDLQVPDWGSAVEVINTVILGLLMGLRNRAAYDRWWEARGLWGQLTNDSRNLAAKLAAYVPAKVLDPSRVGDMLAGFAVALKDHLRGERSRLQNVPGFESEKEDPPHVPLYLSRKLFSLVAGWKRAGDIDDVTVWILDPHLRGLLDVCGGCERIRNTPLSPSYKALLRTGLVVNVLAGPWLAMSAFGPWSVLFFELACFFLLGVELIDSLVEEPFGHERDDLDLDRYCGTIRDGVAASLPLLGEVV